MCTTRSSDVRSRRVRSESGSRQIRSIMVGTAYIHWTRCRSTSSSAALASNRGMTTTWAPSSRARAEVRNGPLWNSGPVVSTVPPGGRPSNGARPTTSSYTAGCPATISFGRPVLPPEVGAFQAGATARGRAPSPVPSRGR